MATYSPGVKPRVKYVYEDVPEEEKPKSKKDQRKTKRTPPLKRKFDDDDARTTTSKDADLTEGSSKKPVVKTSKTSPKIPTDTKLKCARFMIFACCMISLIVSFGMLALGVYLKSDLTFSQFLSENYRQVTETQFTAPTLYKGTYALIVVGILTIVFSFVGCCGAITLNVCLLGTFIGVQIVLFLLQITAGSLWYFNRDAVQEQMALALDYMVQHYYQGPGIVQEVMDSFQRVFRCCGNSGCGDYTALRLTVPRTCDLDCYGCRERIYRVLRDGFTVITVFGAAMLAAELLAIICAMFLICKIKDRPPQTITYELSVVPNYPVPKAESPATRRSPKSEKRSPKPTTKQEPTKIVYVAYPVHAMPPPPPYDGHQKMTTT